MTIFGIDISHHQPDIDLQRVKNEGFQFVIARVGQGAGGQYSTTRDRAWVRHRDETRRVGLRLCAYWYIGNIISPSDNASLCESWIGDKSIPVALDFEAGSGNVAFYRQTLDAFKARGFRVPMSYIPKWYWQQVGSSPLDGLPPLWYSKYVNGTGYASSLYPGDNSSWWTGYGGLPVVMSQFTSSAKVANYTLVDANAFKGTLQELDALLYGTIQPVPEPPPVEGDEMQLDDIVGVVGGREVTVRDVFLDSFKHKDEVIREIRALGESLPKPQRDRFTELCNLLYLQAGQARWAGLASKRWQDLSSVEWVDI